MPIDKEELRKRKWPVPPFPIGHEAVRREEITGVIFYDDAESEVIAAKGGNYAHLPYPDDYLESCYVREGRVVAIRLPIPPGECGVTSLVKDKEEKIFGVTSGEKCHLFVYDPKEGKVEDLGIIGGKCQKSSVVVSSDDCLFMGTKSASGEGYIYSYNSKSTSARIEKLCCPVKGEGISTLAIDNNYPGCYFQRRCVWRMSLDPII
jgi:hypothetical protein